MVPILQEEEPREEIFTMFGLQAKRVQQCAKCQDNVKGEAIKARFNGGNRKFYFCVGCVMMLEARQVIKRSRTKSMKTKYYD